MTFSEGVRCTVTFFRGVRSAPDTGGDKWSRFGCTVYGDLVVGCTVTSVGRTVYARTDTRQSGPARGLRYLHSYSLDYRTTEVGCVSSKTAATQAQTEVGYVSGARMSG